MDIAKNKTYEYDGHSYVSQKMSINIMEKYNTDEGQEILGQIDENSYEIISDDCSFNSDIKDTKKKSLVKSSSNNLFYYKGKKITYIFVDGEFYFKRHVCKRY